MSLMTVNYICLMLSISLIVNVSCTAAPWMNTTLHPEKRAEALLAQMNLDEKIGMVHGINGTYVGNVPPNQRLGIPALNFNDGPQGYRADEYPGTTTQFPSALTVAASFDVELIEEYSKAIAQEFLDKGANVLLGPGMNLVRAPLGARSYEYCVGEDPYLGREMVKAYVKGAQSMGVIATAKHFVNNEQETNRMNISVIVDERVQWELYYQPFQAAIEAGVLSVMCSYNKIHGVYACENNVTLNSHLKEKMGFKGWVMSDWFATHSSADSALNGLDQEMPYNEYFENSLLEAIKAGKVPTQRLDDMVSRILFGMFSAGIFDRPQKLPDPSVNVTRDSHFYLAQKLAAESTVLLKNSGGLLPLNEKKIKSIGIFGASGHLTPIVAGTGSGAVIASHVITPLEGIKNRLANSSINVTYLPTEPLEKTVTAAKDADVALIFVGVSSEEQIDRLNLSLPETENLLVKRIAEINPNTVVIVSSPGALLLPWSDSVPAIIASFLAGQEAGNAIADVIFGDVNPSARLPVTFPNIENEIAFTPEQFPGVNLEIRYLEGLLIGYRWYDSFNVTPKFAFGHGLSYTDFEYKRLIVSPLKSEEKELSIKFKVTNTGLREGAEVVQLYVGFPSDANEPPKQLRKFKKIFLKPSESSKVEFQLTYKDFRYGIKALMTGLLSLESMKL